MGIRGRSWRDIFGEIRRSSHGIWKKEINWGMKLKAFMQNCGRTAINKSDPKYQHFKWNSARLVELQGEFTERFFLLTIHAF
jgi:hypothetical protein